MQAQVSCSTSAEPQCGQLTHSFLLLSSSSPPPPPSPSPLLPLLPPPPSPSPSSFSFALLPFQWWSWSHWCILHTLHSAGEGEGGAGPGSPPGCEDHQDPSCRNVGITGMSALTNKEGFLPIIWLCPPRTGHGVLTILVLCPSPVPLAISSPYPLTPRLIVYYMNASSPAQCTTGSLTA